MAELWRRPLPAHVAVLAVLLLGALALTDPSQAYNEDEGVVIVQARQLERTGSWLYEASVPELDPTSEALPFPRPSVGALGVAPYAKHPAYPLLLQRAEGAAGPVGYYLVSVLGALLAAIGAALIAGKIDGTLARPTLWLVGMASPLFFHAQLVQAHALGSGLVALAVVAAIGALEAPRDSRRPLGLIAGCGALLGAAVLLRTEAVLVGPALAAAAVVAGVRRPEVSRRAAISVAAVSLMAVLAARAGEGRWIATLLGAGGGAQGAPVPAGSFLAERWNGFVATWFDASFSGDTVVNLTLLVASIVVTAAALAARVAERRPGLLVGASAAVAALYVARLAAGPSGPVPGLVLLFPLGWVGLLLVDRSVLRPPAALVAGLTACLVAVGVALTQYSEGGGSEWGGRFFALALPVGAPVLVASLDRARRRLALSLDAQRAILAGGVVAAVAAASLGVWTIRDFHGSVADVLADVEAGAEVAGPVTVGGAVAGPPLVVSGGPLVQMAWPVYEHYEWLLAPSGETAAVGRRLASAGVDHFVWVGGGSKPIPDFGPRFEAQHEVDGRSSSRIVVLART